MRAEGGVEAEDAPLWVEEAETERRLMQAIEMLAHLKVDLLPVQVRQANDKLTVLRTAMGASNTLSRNTTKLLDLACLLGTTRTPRITPPNPPTLHLCIDFNICGLFRLSLLLYHSCQIISPPCFLVSQPPFPPHLRSLFQGRCCPREGPGSARPCIRHRGRRCRGRTIDGKRYKPGR